MITQDMIIADIIARYPETVSVFKKYDLECYECQIADIETISHGAGVHKVDLANLLDSLNKAVKSN